LASILIAANILGATMPVARADVQITGFTDIHFGTWSGSGNLVSTNSLCVYNTVDVNYNVTATAAGGVFQLVNGSNTLDFSVRFKKSGGSYTNLPYNTPIGFDNANTSSANCSGGTNATLEVTIQESALFAARPGTYSGTLTILLEPGA
jgi:hypothetical protein